MDITILILKHAINREFNDKFIDSDYEILVRKCIKWFNLINQKDGRYRIDVDKITIIIEKKKENYKLITLFGRSGSYVMPNIDIQGAKCYFQGPKVGDRLNIQIPTSHQKTYSHEKIYNKKITRFISNHYTNRDFHRHKQIKSKSPILKHYPNARLCIYPSKMNKNRTCYLVDNYDNIILMFNECSYGLLCEGKYEDYANKVGIPLIGEFSILTSTI